MSVKFTQVQRKWLMTHVSGKTAQTPLNDLLRAYYISQIGGPAAYVNSLNDLERQWLRKVIIAAGQTPVDTKYVGSLWGQAVATLGQPVSNYTIQNKIQYYLNAA